MTGARPRSGGGVIVGEGVVTGFVGFQTFGFTLQILPELEPSP